MNLSAALAQLKEYVCERLTVQSGDTINGLFLREKLFDYVTDAARLSELAVLE